ncbi:MAG TPA: OB-fold nucleic acid binding domain-containing protein [Cyanophyceae cyanobacterium]
MVKIIGRKSLGTQPVYDIGVERDHNFILASGLVASNCFNKSHSTAYGYVTYQTAYLKANYPEEYMAALLTASSGNQDKVQKYIATCSTMGIEVEQPDINRSEVDFTAVSRKILFGLSAIRNLGQGAIESILKARQDGPFKSLADLCDRVDLHAVNRRALESLIYCGAFDSLEPNRKQLIANLELLISWGQTRAKDRNSGQTTIFDFLGSSNGTKKSNSAVLESAPKAAPVSDFSPQEKLKHEKEILGFYVSDHPLKSAHKIAKILSPINLNELSEQGKRTTISAIVMLTDVKRIITKKGDPMAIIQMEDLTGQAEGVVFPKSYERIGSMIETDARLIVWGKADQREDKIQMIIEDAEPIETAPMVVVELTPQRVTNDALTNLKAILRDHSGEKNAVKVPVLATIATPYQQQFVRFDSKYWVQHHQTAVTALQNAGFSVHISPLAGS